MSNKLIHKMLQSNDIPTDYLDDVIEKHHKNKAWIAESLGLNAENNWRMEIPLPSDMENKPEVHRFLMALSEMSEGKYTVLDLNFMWKGKNKVRVTKVIGEMWERFIDILEKDCNPTEFGWYCRTQELFESLPTPVHQWKHPNAMAQVLCQYGDVVKNGRIGVISINPYDYFTLSGEGCTYSSCVRMGGEYFNTCLMYLNSDCVVVSYSRDADRTDKVGRSIVYMNPNAVYFGRVYGMMTNADLLLLRSTIHHKLGGDWMKRDSALKCEDFIQNGCGYVDVGYGVYTYKKESEPNKFVLPTGICLECGGRIQDCNEMGKCEDCQDDGYYCSSCGDRIDRESCCYSPSGDALCNSCYDHDCFYCECCERDRWRGDGVYLVDGEYTYCQRCVDNHAYYCNGCEEYFSNDSGDYTTTVDGDYFCPDCADSECFECENCNETRSNSASDTHDVQGEIWCDDCHDSDSSDCDKCGERFPNDDLDDGLCQECYNLKESEDDYGEHRVISGNDCSATP